MRFFRSFRLLLTMIFGTLKNGAWATLLLMLVMYIFAIVFTQAASDYLIDKNVSSDQKRLSMVEDAGQDLLNGNTEDIDVLSHKAVTFYYGTVPRTVFTLFKAIIGGVDWEDVVLPLSDVGPLFV